MPSNARKAFDENVQDVERLMDLHKQKGGSLRGRRFGLEVLNKSAIVLITSFWEAYCEDIAAESLAHIVKYATSAKLLPKELKKQIAKELKANLNELAIWSVADNGWKSVLEKRLIKLKEERNKNLNTPKSVKVDDLFMTALGISKISGSWRLSSRMAPEQARNKLDKYVTLRGSIAHRGVASKSVKKVDVEDYYSLIKKIAAKTGGKVNAHTRSITGRYLWRKRLFEKGG